MKRKRIAIVIGTRPEAIKMAPVVKALQRRSVEFEPIVIATAQHREMLDQVLSLFKIDPQIDLNVMYPNQNLSELTARVLNMMDKTLQTIRPDLLLVQGDTTTVLASSLAAFYNDLPVGHVEAGLRSHDKHNPFPEEISRCLTTVLAEMHFAPTLLAQEKLLREGVSKKKIIVTGNTVIDALFIQLKNPFNFADSPLATIPFDNHRILLVTSHRRESWGEDLENICFALKSLEELFPDLFIVYPVHLNPKVRETVLQLLAGRERIFLTDPLDYITFLNLMKQAYIILTDSGGIQEEAPALRKPLLVLRKLTERPEAFNAGLARVVGVSQQAIVEEASRLLLDDELYRSMSTGLNPYGDGYAAERIVESISRWSHGELPFLEENKEFSYSNCGLGVTNYTTPS
ncbi:MAG: UDP-N-acetylglucosamine 2-epimerase (non-hydrolyzing) [bacterium]